MSLELQESRGAQKETGACWREASESECHRVLVCFLSPSPKAIWRGKGLVHLTLRHHSPPGQEPRGRNCRMPFPRAYLACFIIQPRPTCSGLVPPTVGWTFPHQSLISRMPLGQSDGEISSVEVPSSQMTIACVKFTHACTQAHTYRPTL